MIAGREIELGGTVYIVPPLSLGALERLEDRLKMAPTPGLIVDVVTASLTRNYPDITRERVAELVDTDNCAGIFAAIMGPMPASSIANPEAIVPAAKPKQIKESKA
jgi:hypothetical protein